MSIKVIARNRRAFHEYHIEDRFEAGIELRGTEVKSVRAGKVTLSDGWVDITEDNEAILKQVGITPYTHGNIYNHDEKRERRLLLKKKEIVHLAEAIQAKGYTVVPIQIHLRGQYVKVDIALAKGKKQYDKRDATKEREADRDMARAMRSRNK